ncbi:MAG: sensor histidine kinase [Clostridia bacterium]|nr:sensor histidine kinase [Clostridia bacterium]
MGDFVHNNEQLKKICFTALLTTFMGQVYINPFGSSFRMSMAIVALTLLLLEFDDIPILRTSMVTATTVFCFRVFTDYISTNEAYYILINRHLPAAIFYIVIGVLFFYLKIRELMDSPVRLVMFVGLSDMLANVIEVFIREEFIATSFNAIFTRLFVTGLVRALITLLFFSGIRFYNVLVLREENRQRYEEFIMRSARMKSEVFFLNKTMRDIEVAMNRAYSIYNELKQDDVPIEEPYRGELRDRLLNLSKDIHEIKKDNQRVVFGIEGLISAEETNQPMAVETLIAMVVDNTRRYILSQKKGISIIADVHYAFMTLEYFPLISIINNLVNNSIDAIDEEGYINVVLFKRENHIFVEIIDNGKGIKVQDMGAIFLPGFSTKFNRETGKMSTGIGLSHVKEIVEKHFGGKIYLDPNQEKGTKFTIEIPCERIEL